MFQLIQQDNVFEAREQGLEKEVVYYVRILDQYEDEDTMREEDIPTGTEGPGTNLYDSEDWSDAFVGQATEGDFMRVQRHFYQQYSEYKELSQYIWGAMHTTFPVTSTSDIISKLPMEED